MIADYQMDVHWEQVQHILQAELKRDLAFTLNDIEKADTPLPCIAIFLEKFEMFKSSGKTILSALKFIIAIRYDWATWNIQGHCDVRNSFQPM